MYLIRVSDDQCSLLWKVVVKIRDNLNSHICFSCSWRTNDLQRQKSFNSKINTTEANFVETNTVSTPDETTCLFLMGLLVASSLDKILNLIGFNASRRHGVIWQENKSLTIVRPGCMPARMASIWVGVNWMVFLLENTKVSTLTYRLKHTLKQLLCYAQVGLCRWYIF